ncbi:MAG: DUF5668 domain-containing protein [Bacteroidota bacterium]|jgi:hypothetical protein|nr:DUF5668 domain-containing protein [Bacteroidota bacterium]
MKSGRVFWGTLLVIVGLLGILHNYFDLAISWDALWKLWPLLLILLGISAFLKDSKSKWIVIGGIGLLAGVVIFASVQRGCDGVHRIVDNIDSDDATYTEQELRQEFDSTITHARFHFEGGAGSFEMGDSTDALAAVTVRSSLSPYRLDFEAAGDMPTVHLSMADESVSWHGGKMRNHVVMRLHPDPLWDLGIEAGAANIDFDLRRYRIARLDLDAGAASITVRLGNRADSCHVFVETGAASVHLSIPEDVACEVRTESALSSKNIAGFSTNEDGVYRTDNFDRTDKRMFIHVDSGLSSITVDRDAASAW